MGHFKDIQLYFFISSYANIRESCYIVIRIRLFYFFLQFIKKKIQSFKLYKLNLQKKQIFEEMMEKRLNLRDKVEEINQRFSLKAKKNLSTQSLQTKLSQMKKKLTSLSQKNNEQMQVIRDNAQFLLQKAQQTNISFQNEANIQLSQLDQLTKHLSMQIENEIYLRKQKQNQLVDTIEKKTRFLKQEIQKEKQLRSNILEQISGTLQKDVPSLMKLILDASQDREQNQERITELIQGQLNEYKTKSVEFKEKVEENQKKTFELIRDLTLKAKKEIEEERKTREQTHDEILSYVEQTCNKLSKI